LRLIYQGTSNRGSSKFSTSCHFCIEVLAFFPNAGVSPKTYLVVDAATYLVKVVVVPHLIRSVVANVTLARDWFKAHAAWLVPSGRACIKMIQMSNQVAGKMRKMWTTLKMWMKQAPEQAPDAPVA
jgi:predicted Na+-dependent transporter